MPSLDRAHTRAVRARIALIAYLVFVAFTVWLPAAISGKVVGLVIVLARWTALQGITSYEAALVTVEFLANVAFLVPVGLMLSLAWPRLRLWQVVSIGLGMSAAIESVQALIPSRAPSFSDVLANTLGVLAGAALVSALRRPRRVVTDRLPHEAPRPR